MKSSKIKSIKKIPGTQKVFDIINAGENHNFVANRMVVGNCDESGSFASTSDWNKREVKELRKKLAQIRTKHLFFIMCFPMKITKVEKTFLDSYINYWCDLFGRGVAALYVKDKSAGLDAWRVKDFQKLGTYNEFTNITTIKKILKQHPNFWKIIRAPKPPAAFYSKYLVTRESNVYNNADVMKSTNKEDMLRAMLMITLKDLLQKDSSLSISRLLVYFETVYGLSIDRKTFDNIFEDSKMLVDKIKENHGK